MRVGVLDRQGDGMGAGFPDYAELHCLSNFSFLRGASHPEELVFRAGALGYRALAITDECSLAGVVRAHAEAKRVGLPLIIGSEFRLSCGMKLVLLATDCASYGQLSTLITLARRNADKDKLLYIQLFLERAPFYCESF
jgi:error-prone DNA polymerase